MLSRIGFYRGLISLCLVLIAYLFISELDLRRTILIAKETIISMTFPEQQISVSTSTVCTTSTTVSTSTVTTTTTTTVTTSTVQIIDKSLQPKEAFVTFSNNAPTYLALLKVLLDSVHAFSTRPIIVYGIDVDPDVDTKDYPRLIKRRIAQHDCGPSVYFCKLHAIVSSNVEYGVLMETDDVVNYDIDILFEVLHLWPHSYPLSPRHPDDPSNYHHFMDIHNVTKKTTPYIHAHMIWNFRSLPFLRNLQSLLRQGHFGGANFDETGVNVMLWAAKANHTLCKYDPYFTFSDIYERWPVVTNCTKYCHTVYLTLHGSKESKTSAELLTRLKANAGKPTLQLPGMGGLRYTNDTTVTCCYPDSKPSPIHPLICEHPENV